MPAPKGNRPPNAGKGRPRGTANKMTRSLRDMILGALDDAGGQLTSPSKCIKTRRHS